MKRNALIRIILWSVTLLLLAGMLVFALFGFVGFRRMHRYDTSAETFVPREVMLRMSLEKSVNVRSNPTPDAPVRRILSAGETIEVFMTETIDGIEWAYLLSPAEGWTEMSNLRKDLLPSETVVRETEPCQTIPEETSVAIHLPQDNEKQSFDSSRIRNLDIEWVSGRILVQSADVDQIIIYESKLENQDRAMVIKQEENTLSIDFSREKSRIVFPGNALTKDLTICVPRNWVCNSLEIETASADVEINDLTIRELDFEGASGKCTLDKCSVDQVEVDTASGDIRFRGSLNTLECSAASANVVAILDNVPHRLAMESMSGNLDITLPENAGFTLDLDSMSKNFTTDFENVTIRNDQYRCGDGSCRIRLSAMSGDVTIRKDSAQ